VLNENKEAAAPKHTHHEKKHLEAQVPKNKQTPNQQMKKNRTCYTYTKGRNTTETSREH
jgi:hypothetical protein